MFEKVYIRRFETITGAFSLGIVAELALFYKEVVVEINLGWLTRALTTVSSDTLIRMHNEFGVRFVFIVDFMGVMTEVKPGSLIPRYFISVMEVSKTSAKKDGKEDLADRILKTPHPKECRNSIIRFLDVCEFKHLNDMTPGRRRIEEIAGREILDRHLSAADISEVVRSVAPNYRLPDNLIFHGTKFHPRDTNFMLSSNVSLTDLNRHRLYQSGENITYAHLLGMYANARFELSACANQNSDFVSDDVSGSIIRRRVSDLLLATNHRSSEINYFKRECWVNRRPLFRPSTVGQNP